MVAFFNFFIEIIKHFYLLQRWDAPELTEQERMRAQQERMRAEDLEALLQRYRERFGDLPE